MLSGCSFNKIVFPVNFYSLPDWYAKNIWQLMYTYNLIISSFCDLRSCLVSSYQNENTNFFPLLTFCGICPMVVPSCTGPRLSLATGILPAVAVLDFNVYLQEKHKKRVLVGTSLSLCFAVATVRVHWQTKLNTGTHYKYSKLPVRRVRISWVGDKEICYHSDNNKLASPQNVLRPYAAYEPTEARSDVS